MKKYYLSEISKLFNISSATIRFYDEKGLMPFLKREKNGYRYLNETDIEWIEIIICLKKTGMPVKDIKRYIDLCIKGQTTINERHLMIIKQRTFVEARLFEFQKELKFLKEKENYYQKLINKEVGIKDHPYSYSKN